MKHSGLIKSGFLIVSSSIALSSNAAVVINEIDYDQPKSDTAEFIELFNSGSSIISLDDYSIDLINGSNSKVYQSINLSGFNINANGYFVVCNDGSQIANCDYSFTTSSGWLQNGAPDAVALYGNDQLLDSVSYEGKLSPFTEGDALTISDNNNDITSLSRISNGFDSNNNALDFRLGCITPGSANIEGTGDCSIPQINAVPVPAAVWLFGTGLIGMIGVARRK